MTPADLKLVLVALIAIGALVVLVTRFKVNAFISLLLASLIVGLAAVAMGSKSLTVVGVVKSFSTGLGNVMAGIAAVIGLGTMLGKLLAESGGAEVLAKGFASFFGPKRIQWCVMALALAVGLTTWFAVGFVLLLPILLTLTTRDEAAVPEADAAAAVVHVGHARADAAPPRPRRRGRRAEGEHGPGVVLGLRHRHPDGRHRRTAVRAVRGALRPGEPAAAARQDEVAAAPAYREPGFGLTLWSILLPVVLMLLATLAELLLPKGSRLLMTATFIGHPVMALLIAVLFASWSLGTRCRYTRAQVLKFTEECISAMGMTLLIVGGGGGFAKVLTDAGVAEAISRGGEAMHMPPLLYGWLLAVFIRVATGSATVAITTASGLLVPVLALHPEFTANQIALIIVAMGCGSLFLSHLNDSGFWIVKDFLGLSVSQTLRTWTACETIVGVAGMLLSLVAFMLIS